MPGAISKPITLTKAAIDFVRCDLSHMNTCSFSLVTLSAILLLIDSLICFYLPAVEAGGVAWQL